MAKLLHEPVVRAKALTEGADQQARLLGRLFALEDPGDHEGRQDPPPA